MPNLSTTIAIYVIIDLQMEVFNVRIIKNEIWERGGYGER